MVLGGSSIMNPGLKHHWWQLRLECGHTVERRIRWKRIDRPRRGWAAQHQGPSLSRLPDKDPQYANCELCPQPVLPPQ